MSYWRNAYFQTLKELATEATKSPEWAEYATFCSEYECGLRHRHLPLSNVSWRCWNVHPSRNAVASWAGCCMQLTGHRGQHIAVPHPLRLRMVEPTLGEWTAVEPRCSEPHRWLGGDDHLKLALELDPSDEPGIKKLIAFILGNVGTHELPDRYVGDPHGNLGTRKEAEHLLQGLSSEDKRQRLTGAIQEELLLIRQYLAKGNITRDDC
jgi:hypothetical protein